MKNSKDFSLSMTGWRTAVLAFVVACGNTPAADVSTKNSSGPAPAGSEHAHHHGGHAGGGKGHGQGHHHRFDDAATWSKVFDDPARDAWQKPARVVELMRITPGMSVADVGAGTGYFEPYLSRAVGPSGAVVAEDLEPDMVKWIGERAKREGLANVTAVQGAADDPKLGQDRFDRILIVDTWHHVDARPAFAKKLASALKPGGVVFIVDFTLESPHGPPAAARLAPEAIASDLAAAGLATEVLKDAGLPHQYVVTGKR